MRLVKDKAGRILYTVETRNPKPKPTFMSKIEYAVTIFSYAVFFYGMIALIIILCV